LAGITDFSVASDKMAFSAGDANFGLTTQGGTGTPTSGLARGSVSQGLAASDALVVQNVAQNAVAAAATASVTFFKLTTAVAFSGDVKGTFAAALGSASVTGLAANGNYLMSSFDASSSKMLVGVVNVGGNANANNVLAADDFANADIAVVGVFTMTAADYAEFTAANLANAF
jgi:hypothetical protein